MTVTAKYTPTKGITVGISSTSTSDLSKKPTYIDLSTTVKQINQQGGQATEIDVTTFASAAKETITGLADYGTWALTMNWVENDAGDKLLRAAQETANPYAFKLARSDGSSVETIAYVTQISVDDNINGVSSGTVNLRLSGKPTIKTSATG